MPDSGLRRRGRANRHGRWEQSAQGSRSVFSRSAAGEFWPGFWHARSGPDKTSDSGSGEKASGQTARLVEGAAGSGRADDHRVRRPVTVREDRA